MIAWNTIVFIILIHCSCIAFVFSTWVPNAKMYHIENVNFQTWHDANKHCQQLGLNLLSVRTRDEFDILKQYIQNKYGRIYPYWIGAYRDQGVYKWLAYNETINNLMWHAGEPNDKSTKELCVHTWEGDFDWNDNDCAVTLPFICELQLNVLPGL